ncbi:hypothetical protein [Amycolatopsis sp. La24]|uniref:hypothetical protein n=1 Tax=Amycolatopsis sp. La24 TaxID=3028304 RepID=UPI0023AF56D8|nr:hypothetical protein [Amycolatopsis sp. La24]
MTTNTKSCGARRTVDRDSARSTVAEFLVGAKEILDDVLLEDHAVLTDGVRNARRS